MGVIRGRPPAPVRTLRRSRPFRWYWAGQWLSFLGSHVAAVALPLVAALSIPLLVVVAFLTGVAGIFFEIAGFAYVPSLVPDADLAAANRAAQGSSTVTEGRSTEGSPLLMAELLFMH